MSYDNIKEYALDLELENERLKNVVKQQKEVLHFIGDANTFKVKININNNDTIEFMVSTNYNFQSEADKDLFISSFKEFLLTEDYTVEESA